MPARRLAMRATFSPCSPSGMAQPMTTSSTSAGSTPGARRSTSAMTAAAMSSGRTVFRLPFGALPTAVRVAATITASRMTQAPSRAGAHPSAGVRAAEIGEQILERVADLRLLAVEQVVGAVDDHELLRLLEVRVELLHVPQRNQFVGLAVDDEL